MVWALKNWKIILIGLLMIAVGTLYAANRIKSADLEVSEAALKTANEKVAKLEEAKKLVDAALLQRDEDLEAARKSRDISAAITNAGRNTDQDRPLSPYMKSFVDSLKD